jgi:uncharacterized MAPEG superfamily protein
MLLLIFLVLILLFVLTSIPGRLLVKQVGAKAQIGPRDDLPEPTPELARSRRALENLQETLPIFLAFAILSIVFKEQGWVSLSGGIVYFLARVSHAICYMRGLSPWRSVSYLVGLVGIGLVAGPLVPHIWG